MTPARDPKQEFIMEKMMIIYDDHIWWSYMMIIYDDHTWWSWRYDDHMLMIYDDHIWWSYMMMIMSYMMIIYDDHIWWSYMMIIWESSGRSFYDEQEICDDHLGTRKHLGEYHLRDIWEASGRLQEAPGGSRRLQEEAPGGSRRLREAKSDTPLNYNAQKVP